MTGPGGIPPPSPPPLGNGEAEARIRENNNSKYTIMKKLPIIISIRSICHCRFIWILIWYSTPPYFHFKEVAPWNPCCHRSQRPKPLLRLKLLNRWLLRNQCHRHPALKWVQFHPETGAPTWAWPRDKVLLTLFNLWQFPQMILSRFPKVWPIDHRLWVYYIP